MEYLAFIVFTVLIYAFTVHFRNPSTSIDTLYQLESVHLIAVEKCVFFVDGKRELFYFSGMYFYKYSEMRCEWIKTIDNFDPLEMHKKRFDVLVCNKSTLPKKYLPLPKI